MVDYWRRNAMPITVRWDDVAHTRIFYTVTGAWTWEEFYSVYEDVYEMLDTVNHTVHAIADIRDSKLLPSDTLTQMRRLTFQQHKNGGITIIITENRFAHTLFNILTGALRQAKAIFRMVHSPEEAYEVLAEHEAELVP
jgi:hypothetical protein